MTNARIILNESIKLNDALQKRNTQKKKLKQ